MSNLLLLRGSLIISLLVIGEIMLAGSVSSFDFKISPPSININGELGERICENFFIYSDEKNLEVLIEDRWTNKQKLSNNIEDYYIENYFSLEYDKNYILSYDPVEVCANLERIGFHQGILTFEPVGKNLIVALWIRINVTEERETYNSFTGFAIKELLPVGLDKSSKGFQDYQTLKVLLILEGELVMVFAVLLFLNNRRR